VSKWTGAETVQEKSGFIALSGIKTKVDNIQVREKK
jgi:hypothetical protein